jgi:hypothetical protein
MTTLSTKKCTTINQLCISLFPNENDKTLKLSAEEAHVFNFLLCTEETYNKEMNAMDSVVDEYGINYFK